MQSADANLLLALDALLREGSVTGAARRMSLTPPAMSHTLSRLREALGDPIFVRSGNRLVPTPRALAMRDHVGRVAADIDTLLRPEQPLELALLERTFVVRASDATIAILGSTLDAIARETAPGVALHFVSSPTAGMEVDLDIGVQYNLAPNLRVQRLYQDDMVPVVRKGHALAGRRATPPRLAKHPYVAVASQPAKLLEIAKMRRRRSAPHRVVPSFLAAASLIRSSDAYTHLPARLVDVIGETFGLSRVSGPPATKITIAQAWSARFDHDAAHGWLRECVRRAVNGS